MSTTPSITWQELAQHNKKGDYWLCISNKVYNVSTYLAEHPGGDDVLIKYAGKDATQAFEDQQHSDYAVSIRDSFFVGNIDTTSSKLSDSPSKTLEPDTKKHTKEYTYEEVAKHNTPEDCWIVVHGKVYDPLPFLNEHPGGPTVITNRAGKDCSKAFDEVGHTELATKQMKDLLVGAIKPGSVPLEGADEGAADKLNFKQLLLLLVGLVVGIALFFVFNS